MTFYEYKWRICVLRHAARPSCCTIGSVISGKKEKETHEAWD